MVQKICLDSDIIIEILKNNITIKKKIEELAEAGDEFYTTSINIFETWSGRENNETFLAFLEGLYRISFDEECAKKAASILNALKKQGLMIEPRDMFIGAVCIVNDISLFTNNKKHFERLKQFGLQIIE